MLQDLLAIYMYEPQKTHTVGYCHSRHGHLPVMDRFGHCPVQQLGSHLCNGPPLPLRQDYTDEPEGQDAQIFFIAS